MAEALLRAALARRGIQGVTVASTGTWGVAGEPVTRLAAAVMSDRGIDMHRHRARSLENEHLERADLVVAMTSVHRREIEERMPAAKEKVLLLKELHLMEPRDVGAGAPEDRLRALLAADRPDHRRALDLNDPMGLPVEVYERCAQELEAGVNRLTDLLWP
jgi:protein-tyrosine-phosphatase